MQIDFSKAFILFFLPSFPVSQVDLTAFQGHVVNCECILSSPQVFDKYVIHPLFVHLDIFALEFHKFSASG